MIDFYFWTTPNGYKVMLFFEETGIPYRVIPVNISKGEQFDAEFLEISPNNRIPAVVDQTPVYSNKPMRIFESGAILVYLAEKTGRFLPLDFEARTETLQWLFWQMGGLGPMLGQRLHFSAYAPERIPYAIDRYAKESERHHIRSILAQTEWVIPGRQGAAQILGVNPNTLRSRMQKLGIKRSVSST